LLRTVLLLVPLCLIADGCASDTQRHSLGYGDYLAMSCDQLRQETSRLESERGERTEPSFDNRQDLRETTALRLKELSQARTEKQCSTG
jgi:hypothetical protein